MTIQSNLMSVAIDRVQHVQAVNAGVALAMTRDTDGFVQWAAEAITQECDPGCTDPDCQVITERCIVTAIMVACDGLQAMEGFTAEDAVTFASNVVAAINLAAGVESVEDFDF